MNKTQTCPDRKTLGSHLLGQISGQQADWLDQHIESCPACQQVVERLNPQDPLINDLRTSPSDAIDDPKRFASVIERGKQLQSQIETIQAGDGTETTSPDIAGPINGEPVDDLEIDFLHPPELPDEIGRLGGYRVLEVLGVGGMGVVFRAEDPKLERFVALKVMKPSIAASRSAKDRFVREAKATAAIEHDHIVSIYQVGEDHGVPFIAMRFLRGHSLHATTQKNSPIDPIDVIGLGRQIADGLAAAHRRGLIHRDIKPDNIWIQEEMKRVKILDFGLARRYDEDSRSADSS